MLCICGTLRFEVRRVSGWAGLPVQSMSGLVTGSGKGDISGRA